MGPTLSDKLSNNRNVILLLCFLKVMVLSGRYNVMMLYNLQVFKVMSPLISILILSEVHGNKLQIHTCAQIYK